jgi:anhydro-N-acetylmuramic acid kinase
MDGIDGALVAIDDAGLRVLASRTTPYEADLGARLGAFVRGAYGAEDPLSLLGRLDVEVGEAFAAAALALLAEAGVSPERVRALGSHGQTVRHAPLDRPPFTLQIGDPGRIAVRTGITTVGDFRRQDVALGGQGAPLVPRFHRHLLGDLRETRAVLNLGGIANLTLLPAGAEEAVLGFDTGPANTLLDAWARRLGIGSCDRDGSLASRGRLDEALLARFLDDPYFALPPPKSTGPERFSPAWLDARLERPTPSAADVARTLVELTARTAGGAVVAHSPETTRVVLSGGGVHHPLLVERLREIVAPRPLVTTAAFGIDPDFVEAAAFAWLAHRRLEGQEGNLPSATGARRATPLGGVYLARAEDSGRVRSRRLLDPGQGDQRVAPKGARPRRE